MERDGKLAVTLAFLEGSAVALTVYVMAWLSAYPVLDTWVYTAEALVQVGVLSLCVVAAWYFSDLYDFRATRNLARYIARLPRAGVIFVVLTGGLLSLTPEGTVVSAAPLLWGLVPAIGVSLIVIRASFYRLLGIGLFDQRTLIVGESPLARELVREIKSRPGCGYMIVGIAGESNAAYSETHRELLAGSLGDVQRIIAELRPERVIVALSDLRGRLPVHQLVGAHIGRGVVIEEGMDVYERLTRKLAIESLTPSRVIFSRDFLPSRFSLMNARGLSIFVSMAAVIGFSPLMAVIALAIKCDSPGPILFVQDRVGMGGRRFKLLKFRTMHPTERHQSEWVRDNGHRITRAGRWLRKFRLDELPQLINVLQGDMNLVGPRPHPASNFELLTLVSRNAPECGVEIPFYSLRSMIPPGITGWAQVRYRYANDLDEEIEKMRYDLYYVKHRSLGLDLRILLDTIKIVLCGRGSEGIDESTEGASEHELVDRYDTEQHVPVRQASTGHRDGFHGSAVSARRYTGAAGSNSYFAGREVSKTDAMENVAERRSR